MSFVSGVKSINGVKNAIYNKHPLVIGLNCPYSFQLVDSDLWTPTENYVLRHGGHALCVIGYSDSKYGGSVQIINSWGSSWADNGVVWVKYNDFMNFTREIYELIPLPYSKPEVTPEPETVVVPDPKPEIVVNPSPKPDPEKQLTLSGSVKIVLDDGTTMDFASNYGINRDFYIEPVNPEDNNPSPREEGYKATYVASKPFKSGTRFRLYFDTKQSAYVYLLSYGTKTKKISSIFPFKNYSAYLNKGSEIAIPNEEYYVRMDDNVGTDYLCILYSKVPLIMDDILSIFNSRPNSNFVYNVKHTFRTALKNCGEVEFDPNKISFNAKLLDNIAVLPIIIEIDHIP